eukprot:TRINITY_DN34397_c0_g1_i1.p1 TRINITY_DN34397_c0_g1~~TRINITY_DN34397_c0_g1_i1.p1  ORF type:complete len:322 (-),score=60.34 TRINITY_DN34397_c0_g1_i1:452-1417(-)
MASVRLGGAVEVHISRISGSKVCVIQADRRWNIREVKNEIELHTDVPPCEQNLLAIGMGVTKASLRDRLLLDDIVGVDAVFPAIIHFTLVQLDPVRAKAIEDVLSGRICITAAAPELQANRDFVLSLLDRDGMMLQHVQASFRADEEVIRVAVKQNVEALRHARADKRVLLGVLSHCGAALRVASKQQRSDPELVAAAVPQQGPALQHAAPCRREDREMVLLAVSQDGRALQAAATHLRADKDVVLAAVATHGGALAHADETLQDDPDVVLAAISSDYRAARHASRRLRADRDFSRVAAARDPRSLHYFTRKLRKGSSSTR